MSGVFPLPSIVCGTEAAPPALGGFLPPPPPDPPEDKPPTCSPEAPPVAVNVLGAVGIVKVLLPPTGLLPGSSPAAPAPMTIAQFTADPGTPAIG